MAKCRICEKMCSGWTCSTKCEFKWLHIKSTTTFYERHKKTIKKSNKNTYESNKTKHRIRQNTILQFREDLLISAKNKCQWCGSDKKLEIHHKKYTFSKTLKQEEKNCVVLCQKCHRQLHANLRKLNKF